MASQRRNSVAPQRILTSDSGFAYVFFLSFLPPLLSGFLLVLFSQFFLKNWMQSLHICRSELLTAQERTGLQLVRLMDLNPLAQSLRSALLTAQVELAAALAAENYPLAAHIRLQIQKIQAQRRQLDQTQKSLILQAQVEMDKGLQKVVRRLQAQNQEIQTRLPDLFRYQIHNIRFNRAQPAVHPDRTDIAPVYEPDAPFKERQALHLSWISDFQTQFSERQKWIQIHHKKNDGCSSSLTLTGRHFREILTADKFSLRP